MDGDGIGDSCSERVDVVMLWVDDGRESGWVLEVSNAF